MSLLSGWRVPLRVARRDALRSRGRSALIVAMIAVPVLGMGAIDVMYRTVQIDPQERVELEAGSAADGWVRSSGIDPLTAIKQSVDAQGYGSAPDAPPITPSALATLLPEGSSVATVEQTSAATARDTDLSEGSSVTVATADVRDPLVAGRYHFSGSAPTGPAQLLGTPAFLRWQGVAVGHDVDLKGIDGTVRTYRVVGTLHDPDAASDAYEVLGLPGAFAPDPGGTPTYLVKVPGGLTWTRVQALNAQGYLALSRDVVTHPPARADVPYERDLPQGGPLSAESLFTILIVILVIGLALLEVCLLAGAAFAVGVRRQTRTVGLLVAAGGDSRTVRRSVLGQGLVLGLTASVVGVPLAVALGVGGLALLQHVSPDVYGPFDLRPLELIAIGVIAIVAGLLAAAIPARTASRIDPVRALSGRRGLARTPRRWPLVGVGMALAGGVISLLGALSVVSLYRNATGSRFNVVGAAGLLVLGAALVQIGFIVATPALVGAAGHLARRLPLAPRFALRDAARNRGRSAPAVGAVLAAVAVSSGLLLYVASQDDHDRRHYQAALLPGQGQISLHVYDTAGNPRSVSVPAVRTALEKALPVRSATLVRTLSCPGVDDMSSCGWPSFEIPAVNNCPASGASVSEQRRYAGDWRCASLFDSSGSSYAMSFRADPVGDAGTVQQITGVRSAAAGRILAEGGVVVLDRAYLSGGRAKVDLSLDDGKTKAYSLPAVYVAGSPTRGIQAVWSPAAAARVQHVAADDSLLLSFTRPPTKAELRAARKATTDLGITQSVYVETGYHSAYGPGLLALVGGAALVTLLATGVATGLAQADARPDHATLAAVGATPRLRRRLAGAQSWSLALLGTFLGVVAGLVPAVALVWARPDFDVVVPWRPLTLTLLVVPALAGVGAFLLTRSRLPLDRRLT